MLSTLCPVDATNDVDTDFINLLSANSKLFDQEPVNKLFTPPCSKAVVRLFQYESEFASKTRQSFPPVYFNNGGFYGCEVNFFKENQVFYNDESAVLMMGEETLIDIDTEFDLKLAKGLINYKN